MLISIRLPLELRALKFRVETPAMVYIWAVVAMRIIFRAKDGIIVMELRERAKDTRHG